VRNRLPHHCIDLESDPGAETLLRRVGIQPSECPVVLLGPGRVLSNPSNVELAQALGLRSLSAPEVTSDLVVVGRFCLRLCRPAGGHSVALLR
jgi:thioredoxin reductase (NADPH)